jgi:hypothetical protein
MRDPVPRSHEARRRADPGDSVSRWRAQLAVRNQCIMSAFWDSPLRQANGVIREAAAYRVFGCWEEADPDLCLPLPLTHVALFNSSRSSLAGPAGVEPATPSLRERQSNRAQPCRELRQPAAGRWLTAKMTANQMVSGPRRGGHPRAAQAYNRLDIRGESAGSAVTTNLYVPARTPDSTLKPTLVRADRCNGSAASQDGERAGGPMRGPRPALRAPAAPRGLPESRPQPLSRWSRSSRQLPPEPTWRPQGPRAEPSAAGPRPASDRSIRRRVNRSR